MSYSCCVLPDAPKIGHLFVERDARKTACSISIMPAGRSNHSDEVVNAKDKRDPTGEFNIIEAVGKGKQISL